MYAGLDQRKLRHSQGRAGGLRCRLGSPTVSEVEEDRIESVEVGIGQRAQKERFGGELLPNVVERASGLVFAEFFQNERDTGLKGIVVIDPRRIEQ
jgi:hypothetical protein